MGYGFLKLCAEMEENEEPFLSLKLIWFLTIKSIVCHLWKWDISREHGCYLSCPPPTYTQFCRCPPLHTCILSSAAVPPYIYSVLQLSSPTVHILSSAAVLPYTHFLFLAIPSVQKFRLTSKRKFRFREALSSCAEVLFCLVALITPKCSVSGHIFELLPHSFCTFSHLYRWIWNKEISL